jgi:hypothetical protein
LIRRGRISQRHTSRLFRLHALERFKGEIERDNNRR